MHIFHTMRLVLLLYIVNGHSWIPAVGAVRLVRVWGGVRC